MDERKRAAVRVARLFVATKAPQQLAPRRVQVAVVLEPQAIDDVEPCLWGDAEIDSLPPAGG